MSNRNGEWLLGPLIVLIAAHYLRNGGSILNLPGELLEFLSTIMSVLFIIIRFSILPAGSLILAFVICVASVERKKQYSDVFDSILLAVAAFLTGWAISSLYGLFLGLFLFSFCGVESADQAENCLPWFVIALPIHGIIFALQFAIADHLFSNKARVTKGIFNIVVLYLTNTIAWKFYGCLFPSSQVEYPMWYAYIFQVADISSLVGGAVIGLPFNWRVKLKSAIANKTVLPS